MGSPIRHTSYSKHYVPIPGQLRIKDIEGEATIKDWKSFRAVAQEQYGSSHHKLIFDAIRNPVYCDRDSFGNKDCTVIWMIIDFYNRVWGVLEMHGKIYEQ